VEDSPNHSFTDIRRERLMYRRLVVSGFSMLLGMSLLAGCSTKKWVRQEVAPINQKLTEVGN
jgi:hypothetical protein